MSSRRRPAARRPSSSASAGGRSGRSSAAWRLGSTGHIAAITVATIVAKELTGSASLAGAPAAAVVFGAALGATVLSWLMSRRGRRRGLVAGIRRRRRRGDRRHRDRPGEHRRAAVRLAPDRLREQRQPAVAVRRRGPVPVGSAGDCPLDRGLGGDGRRDRRAEHRRAERRSSRWRWGLPHLAGPYLVPIVLVGLAAILSFVRLRPDPYDLADHHGRPLADTRPASPLAVILRRPAVLVAIVALVVSQFVMVLIMTMTPLHMTDHGHDLASVGIVLSAHIAGMYAFAPISGRLTDRLGSPPVIYGGMAVLAIAAVLAAIAPVEDDRILLVALFLLGFGWNLGYVAGSALLTSGVSIVERTRRPGRCRRPDLEHGGDRLARLGRARGGRGVRGARDPRGSSRGGAAPGS
jgi:hypothetical protein